MSAMNETRREQRERLRHEQAAGYVLAGGASSRMGRNKALLNFGGEPLVVRAASVVAATGIGVTVVGPPELYEPFALRAIPDDEPGLGPLGGIATALGHSDRPWNLILAVDLPNVTAEWLAALLDRAFGSAADAILPRSERGLEPLCSVYHRRCLAPIRSALGRGVRKITDGLAGPPACRIEEIAPEEWNRFAPGGRLLENINTPREYERATMGERR
jgi:molybdopterin-guanine dinucleotide biosynthesis protein A